MRKDRGINGDAQRIEQLGWMLFLKILDDQDEQLELMDPGYISPVPEGFRWRQWAADPEGITGDELLGFVDQRLFPSLKTVASARTAGSRHAWSRARSRTRTTT